MPSLNTPYLRYPSSRVKAPSMLDRSLNSMIEYKMKQAQYQAQQRYNQSVIPTALTDPLINNRVRDYYRNKYEQSISSEIAGRIVGTAEGAISGAIIGTVVADIALLAATIVSPVPGDEAIAATSLGSAIGSIGTAVKSTALGATALSGAGAFQVGAGTIGAGVGATAGFLGSDYSTWYATRDMFSNMWSPKNGVGANVLNTMQFVGNSMDILNGSTLNKSLLYSLVTGDDVGDIIKRSFGIGDTGREDMDFSKIREAIGVDLGMFGNFLFDFAGEVSSDIGAISGIPGKEISKIVYNRQLYNNFIDNVKKVGLNLNGKPNKAIIKLLSDGQYNKLAKVISDNNFSLDNLIKLFGYKDKLEAASDLFKNTKNVKNITNSKIERKLISKLEDVSKQFCDYAVDFSKRNLANQFVKTFEQIDFMDDFFTRNLYRLGSPAISTIHGVKELAKKDASAKYFRNIIGDKMYNFLFGNNAYQNLDDESITLYYDNIKAYEKAYKDMMSEGDPLNYIYQPILDGTNEENDYLIQKFMFNNNITTLNQLYELSKSNPDAMDIWNKIEDYWNNKSSSIEKELDNLTKESNSLNDEIIELNNKIKNDNSPELINQRKSKIIERNKKEVQKIKFLKDSGYININIIKQALKDPKSYSETSHFTAAIKLLKKNKNNKKAIDLLNNTYKNMIDKLSEGNELINSFFSMYFGREAKEYIKEFIRDDIKKQFETLYNSKYNSLVKFATDNSVEYAKRFYKEYDKKLEDYLASIKKSDNNLYKKIAAERSKIKNSIQDDTKKANALNKLISKYDEIYSESSDEFIYSFNKSIKEQEVIINKLRHALEPLSLKLDNNKYFRGLYKISNTVADKEIIDAVDYILNNGFSKLESLKVGYSSIIDELTNMNLLNDESYEYLIKEFSKILDKPSAFLGKESRFVNTKLYDSIVLELNKHTKKGYDKAIAILNTIKENLSSTITEDNITIWKLYKSEKSKIYADFYETFAKIQSDQIDIFIKDVKALKAKLNKELISDDLIELTNKLNKNIRSINKSYKNIVFVFSMYEGTMRSSYKINVEEFFKATKNKINYVKNDFKNYIKILFRSDISLDKQDKSANKILKIIFDRNRESYLEYLSGLDTEGIFGFSPKLDSETFINDYNNVFKEFIDVDSLTKEQINNIKNFINRISIFDSLSNIQGEFNKFESSTLLFNKLLNTDNDTVYRIDNIIQKRLSSYMNLPDDFDFTNLSEQYNMLHEITGLLFIGANSSIFSKCYGSILNYIQNTFRNLASEYGSHHYNTILENIRETTKKSPAIDKIINVYKVLNSFYEKYNNVLGFDSKIIQNLDLDFKIDYKTLSCNFVSKFENPFIKEFFKNFININKEDVLQLSKLYGGDIRRQDKLKKILNDLRDDNGIFSSLSIDEQNSINNILGTKNINTSTVEELNKSIDDLAQKQSKKFFDDHFKDIRNIDGVSSIIWDGVPKIDNPRKDPRIKQDEYFNHKISEYINKIVGFDTETISKNGYIYELSYYYTDINNEKQKVKLVLDYNYVKKYWENLIDDDVDKFNSLDDPINYKGSTLRRIQELNNTDGYIICSSPQELARYITNDKNITSDSLLVAHNAKFDIYHLLNQMTMDENNINGLYAIKDGVRDTKSLTEFGKQNFKYRVIDPMIIQSYFGLFDNKISKGSTSTDFGINILKANAIYKRYDPTTNSFKYFLKRFDKNGNPFEKEITKSNAEKLRLDSSKRVFYFDQDIYGNINVLYNNKPLHYASNDIDLMQDWFEQSIKNLDEYNVYLNDLTNSKTFHSKIINRRLRNIYNTDYTFIKGSREEVKNIKTLFKEIDESIKDVDELLEDSEDYSTYIKNEFYKLPSCYSEIIYYYRELQTAIQNNDLNVIDSLNSLKDIFNRYKFINNNDIRLSDLDEMKLKEVIDVDDYPELENIFNICNILDTQITNLEKELKFNKIATTGSDIGVFGLNQTYTRMSIMNTFQNDADIKNMFDFINGIENSELSTDELLFSKNLQNKLKEFNFSEIKNRLQIFKDSCEFYNSFFNEEIPPDMWDTFDNVLKKLHDKFDTREIAESKAHSFLLKRIQQNNFDYETAEELFKKLVDNYDTIKFIDSTEVNYLYREIKDNFLDKLTDYINNIDITGLKNNEFELILKQTRNINNIFNLGFNALREPFKLAKNENRKMMLEPFSLKELSQISEINKKRVSDINENYFNLYGSKYFTDFNGTEFGFEDGVHRLMPAEYARYNAKFVPRFDESFRSGMTSKGIVNGIESHFNNFKAPEDSAYHNKIYVDFQEQRLSQNYISAANLIGMDPNEFLDSIYSTEVYLNFSNRKNSIYLDLYNTILNNPEAFNINSKDMLIFDSNLNSSNFSYLKDLESYKNRVKSALAYNVMKSNELTDNDVLEAFKENRVPNSKVFKALKETSKDFFDENGNLIENKSYMKFNKLYYNDQRFRVTVDTANETFNTVKSLYINQDGSVNTKGFAKYFEEHPWFRLFYVDDTGKIKRLDPKDTNISTKLLSENRLAFVSSYDDFISLTNTVQPIELTGIAKWMKDYLLRPMKVFSLINPTFVTQNIIAASFQNMISSEHKYGMPETISRLISTAKNYNKFRSIHDIITNSSIVNKYIGNSFMALDYDWINLLTNQKFLDELKNINLDSYNILSKLTKEDLDMLKLYNDLLHTSAAYGEINELTKMNNYRAKRKEEANQAKIDLEEVLKPYGISSIENIRFDDIKKLNLSDEEMDHIKPIFNKYIRDKYYSMSIEELENELIEMKSNRLESISKNKSTYWYNNQIRYINDAITQKKSDKKNALYNMSLLKKYFNFNNDIETIVRVSAIEDYIKNGMTFDEATYEVIKRQFLYNNKSMAEQYAEFVIPFISYPLRMLNLVESMTSDYSTMRLLYWYDKYTWQEEDQQSKNSEYLTKRRSRGDVPIGNKLLQVSSPFNEGLMTLTNPIYTINNKLNPIAKPIVDIAFGSKYNRWNQLPIISNVSTLGTTITDPVSLFTSDYYRYNSYGNYYLPRYNNRIRGTLYNRMYTKSGYSRVLMNMQPLDTSNLKYRVNSIMKYGGPYRG